MPIDFPSQGERGTRGPLAGQPDGPEPSGRGGAVTVPGLQGGIVIGLVAHGLLRLR